MVLGRESLAFGMLWLLLAIVSVLVFGYSSSLAGQPLFGGKLLQD